MFLLPRFALLEEILWVETNSKSVRERVVRRGRFALITPFLDKYEIGKEEALPPYLCIVRYGFNRRQYAQEILTSLDGTSFQAAPFDRLLDLCRAYPKRQFGYRIAFLGTPWHLGPMVGMTGYPCLRETADGARIIGSTLDCNRFSAEWRVALQPRSIHAVEEFLQPEATWARRLLAAST
ncbi:MAG: hypothetical protein WD889_01325 [Candidatus Colwellbacteria bacterium]